MKLFSKSTLVLIILWFTCCSSESKSNENSTEEDIITGVEAKVTEVAISGNENAYTFNVTISSPDTGCNQYADWWEVLDVNGNLIYRRILGHSHVNEQPFTRSGGIINITADMEIYVRVHMNTTGYSLNTQKGTVASGFQVSTMAEDFALDLANQEPLPTNCAF